MKNLLAIIILTMGISSVAQAGQTCSWVFGNYVCTGTGKDAGYNTTTSKVFNNDVTTDNRGNTRTCSWVFKQYVCN